MAIAFLVCTCQNSSMTQRDTQDLLFENKRIGGLKQNESPSHSILHSHNSLFEAIIFDMKNKCFP